MSEFTVSILHDIMLATALKRINITSTYRSPADQVRVMLSNFIPSKTMYKAAGKAVENIARVENYNKSDRGTAKEAQVLAAMSQELEHQQHVHGLGCVSHHQKDPTSVNVIDIAAASVKPHSELAKFVYNLTNSVFIARIGLPASMKTYSAKHFHETAHCIHLEIPQPKL